MTMTGLLVWLCVLSMSHCLGLHVDKDTLLTTGSDTTDALLHLYQLFHFVDIDDDGYFEYDDALKLFRIMDKDRDGFLSYQEMTNDKNLKTFTLEKFNKYDLDKDGLRSVMEVQKVFFDVLAEFGNDIDLEEYLGSLYPHENTSQLKIIIKAFAQSVNDFYILDTDDDDLVTEEEFRAEGWAADYDRNGILDKTELKGFIPMRHFQTASLCMAHSGCQLEELNSLFQEADVDRNGFLQLEEYVRYFLKET